MFLIPHQLKEAASEITSKSEQIAALDAELSTLREKLVEAEARASTQSEEFEKLQAAVKEGEEARAKLEADIAALQSAGSNASDATAQHAKIQEEVEACATRALLYLLY